jgi:hypothetical protein
MHTDYLVYEHWRSDTNTCFYVGKSNARSNRAHRFSNRSKHHNGVVAKLSATGHEVIVKVVDRDLPEVSAHILERMRISTYRALGFSLANHTDGGEGVSGHRHDEAFKKRVSQFFSGRKASASTRQKMSENNPMSRPEVRAKLSGDNNHMRREEQRAKMRGEQNVAKREDVRKKIRDNNAMKDPVLAARLGAARQGERHPMFGKKQTDEARAKMRAAAVLRRGAKELGGVAAPGSGN